MKKRIVDVACILFGCVLLATPLAAQLPTADRIPPKLTLEEALRLARTHSPTFLQTGNDVDIASANVRSAYGQFLPSLNANLGVNGGQSHVETYPDPITQKPEQLPNPTTATGSSANQGLSMGVTLFDGGRMLKNLAVQKANLNATSALIAVQEDALEAAVRQAFFTALREEQSIALSERLLVSAQERLTQTEALFRTAAKGQVDLLGAREEIATQQMAVMRAKTDATKARLALAQVIGISTDGNFALDGSLPEVYDPETLNVDALLALALQSNPSVRRQELAVGIADKQASAASAGRWPTLGASMSYGRNVSVPEFGALTAPYKYLNPQNTNFGFGFSVQLPVFRNFATSASIATARAGAQDARLQLAQVRLQLQTDVRTAYIDFVNAYRSLQLADTKAALSDERLSLSQDQYRRGTITFSELQQMIDRAAASQRDALNARYGWISSLITLELRIGSPVVR